MQDFEKLGAFYLGRTYDLATGRREDDLVLYDARDLVTHGVCLGMTGSGKTGLCLSLLEEAALDGIPVIAIDPKGDLGNLLLTFPDLLPSDFRPWINEDDARRKGLTADQYAADQAERWRKGLAEWGEDGARIGRLRQAADFSIYTPGSTAGLPLSILKSLDPPPSALLDDAELFGERVSTTATSLLTLAGIDAEPVRSREHILVSTVLRHAWGSGRGIDVAGIIQGVQHPPVQRIGVLEVESFFPANDRFALATAFNNLLAAPGFESWMEGAPLSIDRLLFTPEGRPRLSVISIAHLGERERMFFVSLLFNEVLGWMRAQPGTTSLRALVYMDEVFGYFPPVANPPSKTPLLTLLKQGRAYGVGVLLATQNPVDLDYKGLSNAGTWFLGRLQTERDKARVLEGLEGAVTGVGGRFDRAFYDKALSSLGSRIFLMNNVHDDAPVAFETRWAMSYLRGPLTREQIRVLMAPQKAASRAMPPASEAATPTTLGAFVTPAAAARPPGEGTDVRPVLPPGIQQLFVPAGGRFPDTAARAYAARVLGIASVSFTDAKLKISHRTSFLLLAAIDRRVGSVTWDDAEVSDLLPQDLADLPAEGAAFAPLPPSAAQAKSYGVWGRELKAWLSQSQQLDLLRSSQTGLTSMPGESERDFRIRLQTAAREQRDAAVSRLRQKYAAKLAALDERLRRAEQSVRRESEQASQQKLQTAFSVGATVLGALLGRKKVSTSTLGRATTAARGMGRTMKETQDIERARETVEAMQRQKSELESQVQAEIDTIGAAFDPVAEPLTPVVLRPKRGDVSVQLVGLAWVPVG